MRFFLVLLWGFSFSVMHAQPGGGGRRSGGGIPRGSGETGNMERPKPVEFNATKVAGIFNYDDENTIKKIKIKKKEEGLKFKIQSALETYNNKVNEIALLNKDNFDTLNVYVNAKMKAMQFNRSQGGFSMNRDEESTNSKAPDRALIEAKIRPAKIKVKAEEAKLNKTLEGVLSEKQYAKWLKYQALVKAEQNPKQESNRGDAAGMSRGGRQGGRPGGGMR